MESSCDVENNLVGETADSEGLRQGTGVLAADRSGQDLGNTATARETRRSSAESELPESA